MLSRRVGTSLRSAQVPFDDQLSRLQLTPFQPGIGGQFFNQRGTMRDSVAHLGEEQAALFTRLGAMTVQ
jgi:hypothetical protein